MREVKKTRAEPQVPLSKLVMNKKKLIRNYFFTVTVAFFFLLVSYTREDPINTEE